MFSASDVKQLTGVLQPLVFDIDKDGTIIKKPIVQKYLNHYKINFSQSIAGVRHGLGTMVVGEETIVAQYWVPDISRGTVFVLHGYYDHVGLFHHIIRFALQNQFAVVAYDLPGMGLSTGPRASIGSFNEYYQVLQHCQQCFKNVVPAPWHCIAQSAGATSVMKQLLEKGPAPFEKIILLAPLVRSLGWTRDRWLYTFARFFVRSLPRVFTNNSHDQEFLDFIKKSDPLQHRRLPVRWVGAMREWIARFSRYEPVDYPVLVVQGDQDMTVDWEYNLPVVQEKLPRTKVTMIPQAKHHLVAESAPYRAQVFAAIKKYWDKKL